MLASSSKPKSAIKTIRLQREDRVKGRKNSTEKSGRNVKKSFGGNLQKSAAFVGGF